MSAPEWHQRERQKKSQRAENGEVDDVYLRELILTSAVWRRDMTALALRMSRTARAR